MSTDINNRHLKKSTLLSLLKTIVFLFSNFLIWGVATGVTTLGCLQTGFCLQKLGYSLHALHAKDFNCFGAKHQWK